MNYQIQNEEQERTEVRDASATIIGMLNSGNFDDFLLCLSLLKSRDVLALDYHTQKEILRLIWARISSYRVNEASIVNGNSVAGNWRWSMYFPYGALVSKYHNTHKHDREKEDYKAYHAMSSHAKIKFLIEEIEKVPL